MVEYWNGDWIKQRQTTIMERPQLKGTVISAVHSVIGNTRYNGEDNSLNNTLEAEPTDVIEDHMDDK